MSWKNVLRLFRKGEGQIGPPDTVSSNANAEVKDARVLDDEEYQRANEEISASHAEVERLRAEYAALADSVRKAEWRLQHALGALKRLKCRRGV